MSQPPNSAATEGPGGPPTGEEGVGSGGVKANYQPNKRLQQTQAQVDEVVDIMRVNVEKVLDRDAKISNLDDRAAELSANSQQFMRTTTRVRRKYFWQNIKMMIVIGVIVAIILIIIIIAIATSVKSDPAPKPPPVTAGP